MRVFRKHARVQYKKQAEALRKQVIIKTLQTGGRIVATIDPVTGRVLKREKNPRYAPEDKEFKRLLKKKKAQQSNG